MLGVLMNEGGWLGVQIDIIPSASAPAPCLCTQQTFVIHKSEWKKDQGFSFCKLSFSARATDAGQ